ncbi:SIMPL domain-containing protein [Pontibacter anaerobius]|uniref:SIMPL domain-containing protein n=1 Tax=Pontibacter anaerobius TaxID=2993940 RepID=A0ABT3RJ31_9BACT|nr:SIMPL domain-containing protein [Pontibacter anaerobius]MCX2741815.1 SIMPL domain-containing protein [Pontibacter anaerobius]
MTRNSLLYPTIVLGISLIISALLLSQVFRFRDQANQTINVTGSAKREISSDLGILRSNIQAEAGTAEEAYQRLLEQRPTVLQYLKGKGFAEADIELNTINLNPIYEVTSQGYSTNRIIQYNANQLVQVTSQDVQKIKAVSLDMTSLVSKGINIMVMPPEYYFTKLADLKIEIQADAAKDALHRAQKIAEATGSDLGAITNARMGVIQITPVNSNMISDYGINDATSIEKEITAVVSASFRLD